MEDNSHMFDEDEAKLAKDKWTSMPGQDPQIKTTASFSAEVNDETKHSTDSDSKTQTPQFDYSNYGRPKFDPYTGKPLVVKTPRGKSAMIIGIISLVLFLSYINIPLAIVAIVLGIMGLKSDKTKKMAIIGITTAVLSLVLFTGSMIFISSNSQIEDLMNDDKIVNVFGVDYLDDIDTSTEQDL